MKILAASALALLAGTSVLAYTGQSDWADETLRSAEANNIMPYVIEISDVSMPGNAGGVCGCCRKAL